MVLPLTLLTVLCAGIWKLWFMGGGVYVVTGEELTDHSLLYGALFLSIPGSLLVGYALVLLSKRFMQLEGIPAKIGGMVLLLICLCLGIGGIEIPWILLATVVFFLTEKKEFASLNERGEVLYKKLSALLAVPEMAWTGLTEKLGKLLEEDESGSEDDFMNSKKGKIVTVVCILMVIYMIASSFAIYKLNAKINSVYEITQEMK